MARTAPSPSESLASLHNADKENSFVELHLDHNMAAAYKEPLSKELMTDVVDETPTFKVESNGDALPEDFYFDHNMAAACKTAADKAAADKESNAKERMIDIVDENPSFEDESDIDAQPEDFYFDHNMAAAYNAAADKAAADKESISKERMTDVVDETPSFEVEGDTDALPEEPLFDYSMAAAYKISAARV